MEYFQEEFLAEGVVDGQMIADKLFAEAVIPASLRYRLMAADDYHKVASEIFNQMKGQGDSASLRSLCEIMMEEVGMMRMNKLGKKMLECLEASKFISWYLHTCYVVHLCIHLRVHVVLQVHKPANPHAYHESQHAHIRTSVCTFT